MNKRNFVTGFQPDKADFDGLQNDLEGGLKRVASTVAGKGIRSGFDVSISGSTATVTPGTGVDGIGNPLVSTKNVTVNLGSITRPPSGQYKWVSVILRFQVKESGQVLDIYNKPHPYLFLDSLAAEVLEGSAGAASAISKPSVTDYQVLMADLRVDNSSPWGNLILEKGRRKSLIPISQASSKLTEHTATRTNPHSVTKAQVGLGNVPNWSAGSSSSPGNAADKIVSEAAMKKYVESLFPVGMPYFQVPGAKTPSGLGWPGTWTAQFENEGVFFRTPGGNALPFESGVQADAFQGHTIRAKSVYGNSAGSERGWSAHGGVYGQDVSLPNSSHGSYFSSYGSYGTPRIAVETRSKNRTMRLWLRTA